MWIPKIFAGKCICQSLRACSVCKDFLLIHFACFFRDTLSDDDVVRYVNTHMLFWACSVSTSEGYRVVQSLRANTYPFLALIVLRDSRMTVVAR